MRDYCTFHGAYASACGDCNHAARLKARRTESSLLEWRNTAELRAKDLADSTRENFALQGLNAELLAALREIARPKFGGLEPSTTTEEALEYWNKACERERMTARAAIAKAEGKS